MRSHRLALSRLSARHQIGFRALLLLAFAGATPLWLASCADDEGGTISYYDPDLYMNRFPDFGIHCPEVFPQFDKRCASVSDCEVAQHQLDCCGSLMVVSVSKTSADKMATFEASCRGMLGMCKCVAKPTVVEDGKVLNGAQEVLLDCLRGMCSVTAK